MPLPPTMLRASDDENARMRRLSGEQLPDPKHGSEALNRVVLKACAYDPKERFGSAEEMRHALELLVQPESKLKLEEKDKIRYAPKVELKPETKPESKPEPKPEPRPEPKLEPKPEPKSEPKPELKPDPKPEPVIAHNPVQAKKKKSIWLYCVAVALIVGIASICCVRLGSTPACVHEWSDEIVCTETRSCIKCGAISKDKRDHDWYEDTGAISLCHNCPSYKENIYHNGELVAWTVYDQIDYGVVKNVNSYVNGAEIRWLENGQMIRWYYESNTKTDCSLFYDGQVYGCIGENEGISWEDYFAAVSGILPVDSYSPGKWPLMHLIKDGVEIGQAGLVMNAEGAKYIMIHTGAQDEDPRTVDVYSVFE